MSEIKCIRPDWKVPDKVKALVTTRVGGVSQAEWQGLNLADHVEDNNEHVQLNRALLKQQMQLPAEPLWLKQVHSTVVADDHNLEKSICADARISSQANQICVVLTADCLPVFMCDSMGTQVAAIHAGWRGLANGILEATVSQFACEASEIHTWLGPAIGPSAFEVGPEVRDIFVAEHSAAENAFVTNRSGHFMADIYSLARIRLNAIGVKHIAGGGMCTYTDANQFYSYRRDGRTGRMASLIWISA